MEEKLKKLLNNAYAPYSGYRVSAIARCNDTLYTGVNVENASYGATICAERVAITKAIADGNKEIDEMFIMVDSEKLGTCCFICRQVISEFFKEDSYITCYNNNGEFKKFQVKELCPYPFNKENL